LSSPRWPPPFADNFIIPAFYEKSKKMKEKIKKRGLGGRLERV